MRTTRNRVAAGVLFTALTLSGCGGYGRDGSENPNVGANEAPPAAPFGINVQNQNDDNNIMKYRESMTVHDEGRLQGLSKPEVSQKLAEALTTMEDVQTAHVLVSGDQAFVAVTLRDNPAGGVSPFFKGTVSDKIRTMEPAIKQVYVTDNPDYIRRFEAIRSNQQDRNTADGMLRELSEAIGRLVPTWTVGNNPPPAYP